MEDEETEADVKTFVATPLNSSGGVISNDPGLEEPVRPAPAKPRVPLNMFYDMTGAKYMHIFNHFEYENNEYYGPKASEKLTRWGTHEDVESLEDTFKSLGFKTTVHHDLRYKDILKEMYKVWSMDHSATSCVVVAIMTHGQNGGVLMAFDRPYRFSELTDMMQNGHPSLEGKPKLFFVQACRSGHMDSGRPALLDGENIILPKHDDTLFMYSAMQHYYSYRDEDNGSWLMQSLCEVLNEHHQFLDLLQMLTLVNQDVAYKSTYNTEDPKKSNKKQMTETIHKLTRLLKF